MLHKKTITKSPFSTTPQNRRHQNPKTEHEQNPKRNKNQYGPFSAITTQNTHGTSRPEPTKINHNQPTKIKNISTQKITTKSQYKKKVMRASVSQ